MTDNPQQARAKATHRKDCKCKDKGKDELHEGLRKDPMRPEARRFGKNATSAGRGEHKERHCWIKKTYETRKRQRKQHKSHTAPEKRMENTSDISSRSDDTQERTKITTCELKLVRELCVDRFVVAVLIGEVGRTLSENMSEDGETD